jgi:uncharacterized membrane-anchored protein YitT (DUF2179 family)
MSPIFTQIIINTILRKKRRRKGKAERIYTQAELEKGRKEFKRISRRFLKDFIMMVLGIASAAFGLKGFLVPNGFIDGGVTGISLLVNELTKLPLGFLILCINIPFVFMGFKVVSRDFALKTAFCIGGLALIITIVDIPPITDDKLLISIFGGFFLGAGIGFSVRGGAVLDGTEVLAIFLSRKLGTTIGDIIIALNVIIFAVAAYFLSIQTALFAMITYFVASKTLDYIVEGIDEYTGVTIISSQSNDIRLMIIRRMGRGVTVFKGKGGYGRRGESSEIDILYTVITRLELNKLKAEIMRIDPEAFVVMSSVKDTKGGMIKKRRLHT